MTDNFNANAPIGIFDSGLGGLTVVNAVQRLLPQEHIVYFGDTARVPYGTKSKESVIRFSLQNTDILLRYGVKLIVVACNTSSSWALPSIKKMSRVPVLGVIEPGVQRALELSVNKRVGVIATPSTINSGKYVTLLKKREPTLKVLSFPCPLFVPLAEEGWGSSSVAHVVAETYLKSMKKGRVDTLILGCTHYPLLRKTIQDVMGTEVALVDSADVMAQKINNTLSQRGLLRSRKTKSKTTYIVSDQAEHFRKLAKRFLGHDIGKVKRLKFS